MPHLAILSSSVRQGRASHRVALYFEKYIKGNHSATTEIIDLMTYDFPIFKERASYLKDFPPGAEEFMNRIKGADGVIIVTPEYNGGYPAALKNAIDFLYAEWHRKPIAIATVSDGSFGGTQVITSLQFSLWKIRAWVVAAMFPVPKVKDSYDEQGNALNKEATDKRAAIFVNELLWCVEAKKRMQN